MVKLNLVVVGAGLIGKEHCRLIVNHEAANLVGIADTEPQVSKFASDTGAPLYHNCAFMLDKIKPDGAIIALPNALHLDAGLACIERGIPCFIGKPL